MSEPTYAELLQRPEWQKVRLQVLDRAGFICEGCRKDRGRQLHVHHTYYVKNRAPWSYPLLSLYALCERCHKRAEELRLALIEQAGTISIRDIDQVIGYMRGLASFNDRHQPNFEWQMPQLDNDEQRHGYLDFNRTINWMADQIALRNLLEEGDERLILFPDRRTA